MRDAIDYELLTHAAVSPLLEEMTFPAYRRLLSLEPGVRHPELGQQRLVQPHAIVASQGGVPVGLALFEQPVDAPHEAEVLSLFVAPDLRNHGIATTLLGRVEDRARALRIETVSAVYMTGKPSVPALERVFEKAGWRQPEMRALSVRFTPDDAARMPWFGRVRLRAADYAIVPWADLAEIEKAEIVRSHQETGWIVEGLEPWRHDFYGFDPVSSLGLRYRGLVVGWVINHEIRPGAVRFTCSFVRVDLGRQGRIFALYTESILRLQGSGCRECSLVTPVRYPDMARFLDRRCSPWVTERVETRGTSKSLGA